MGGIMWTWESWVVVMYSLRTITNDRNDLMALIRSDSGKVTSDFPTSSKYYEFHVVQQDLSWEWNGDVG